MARIGFFEKRVPIDDLNAGVRRETPIRPELRSRIHCAEQRLSSKNCGETRSAPSGGVTRGAAPVQLAITVRSQATAEARGAGRPVQRWCLTDEGHARFPDGHADLTVQLIQGIRSELGESSLERLIAAPPGVPGRS